MAKSEKVTKYFVVGCLENFLSFPIPLRMSENPQHGLILGKKGKLVL